MVNEIVISPVQLPSVATFSVPMLTALTSALGINRSVLASDEQIQNAWQNLPQLLNNIPPALRSEGIMRMCVAVASGLFDSAINYAWNAAVVELRDKVRRFGIHIIPQIIDRDFDEKKLLDMQDAELLTLCLKLNLISETGYFMLDQCRDIRNNFSAAHPVIGTIDEYEFISFLNRCSRHALSDEQNMAGVDIKEFMTALNVAGFSPEQMQIWCHRIGQTFNAQRDAIFGMLHGIYCDPAKEEHSRVTAITVCNNFASSFSPSAVSLLINQHHKYQAKGEQDRFKASQAFFENLKLIGLLSETERHALISNACKNLTAVHQGMNNFYNERPFAERVAKLSEGHQIPETVRREFVEAVVTCSVGNPYGTASSADIYYMQMIKGFSPREIQAMFDVTSSGTVLAERIKSHSRCRSKFKAIVQSLQPSSIPTTSKSIYEKWMQT
ncbi:hypothetical protein [Agrobacterium sp. LAD9]|uniref:hypothetical protein n=1 Tax=Agrobacterium sp. LAD9 TaxID=2055153 RepID=UPI00192DE5C8|nr:hypothetical protein [Agrobacterium sp. LAD9]